MRDQDLISKASLLPTLIDSPLWRIPLQGIGRQHDAGYIQVLTDLDILEKYPLLSISSEWHGRNIVGILFGPGR